MKTSKEILKWLTANLGKGCTAPLTSTDTFALVTSVNLTNLIGYSSAPQELFDAYGAIVRQMQEHTRHLAYHAIAMELDWTHREMIWRKAFTIADVLQLDLPTSKCAWEPGGIAWRK